MCPSCDFIINRQHTLYKQKKRENLIKFITKNVLKNKNHINNIKCILDSSQISDEFIKNIPLINGEEDAKQSVAENNYLNVKKNIYDKMWNECGDDNNKLCSHITINIIKLLNHSPIKQLSLQKEKYKLWISKLLFHPQAKIRQTATKYIYILFYYFFGCFESNKPDAFFTIYGKSGDLKQKFKIPAGLNGANDDELIRIHKNVRHKIITNSIANFYDMIAIYRNNNDDTFAWTKEDDIILRSSISCILESESQIQFEMISHILSSITIKPLTTYNQLLRISKFNSSHSSFSNISLLLQTFSNKNNGGNRLFQQYLHRHLIKSRKKINIISKDLLKIDGKIYFNEMLSNIFPKLVFNKDIKTIKAISKYLNRRTADIALCLLHKILPKILISIYENGDTDTCTDPFGWIESNLFQNKRKFLSLLKERPSSLVNELIFICGSGLDIDSTKKRNNTRLNAQNALSYLAVAIGEKQEKNNKKKQKNKKKKYSDESNDESDDDEDEEIEARSCLLAQYASEILLGFGQKLNAKSGDEEIIASNKRKTLRSLRAMIKLLDNKLPQFASKIITLLKMAMNDQKLRSQTLSVWKDFFNYLSGKHLAQNFAQIVVTLLNFLELPASLSVLSSPSPYDNNEMDLDIDFNDDDDIGGIGDDYFALTQNPIVLQQGDNNNMAMDVDMEMNNENGNQFMEQGFLTQAPMSHNRNNNNNGNAVPENTNNAQIISLLKGIIINKKKFTSSHYHEIPILPNIASLKQISDAIQNKLGNQSLESKLTHIVSLLRNESNGIKKMALNTLLYTMQKQRKKMESTILSNIRYEPLLHNLIHSVLPLTACNDNEILILCANALGELGAIDFAALNSHKLSQFDNDDDADDDGDSLLLYTDNGDSDEKDVIILDDSDIDSDLEVIDLKKRKKKKKKSKKGKKKGKSNKYKKKKKKRKEKIPEKAQEDERKEAIPKYIDNINDLALDIVKNYLIPIHRSSNNATTQNQAQYALQELLNVLQCNLNTPNEYVKTCANNTNKSLSISVRNWQQFTEDMQELLQPCLRSTFVIKSENANDKSDKLSEEDTKRKSKTKMDTNNDKVFLNIMYQHGRISLDQWLYKFCKLLLLKIEEMHLEIKNECKQQNHSRNHNSKRRKQSLRSSNYSKYKLLVQDNDKKLKTFKACLCVKNHTFLTTYLLPFLVYELLKKKEFICIVINEIRDVIEYEHIILSQQIQLCIHRIFYLFDVLMSWYYKVPSELSTTSKYKDSAEGKERRSKARTEMLQFKAFFDLLPYLSLSKAANICKSYSRSIKYFAIYVFSNKSKKKLLHNKKNDNGGRTLPLSVISTGQLTKNEINFWQKIQSETSEIDSMLGISVFRMDTNIQQQALDFETNGKWNRALNCYEQILQCTPHNIDTHKKYLKCLLYLGHFSAVISHVKGVQYIKNIKEKQLQSNANQLARLPTLTNMTAHSLSTAIVEVSNEDNNNNNEFDDFYMYSSHIHHNQHEEAEQAENNNSNTNHDIIDKLALFGIESSWRLQQWQLLDEFIEKCNKKQMETEFECKLGDCLSILHLNPKFMDNNLTLKFKKEIDAARLIVIKKISSCYMEGYNAVYPYLAQLHMLQEITHYQHTFNCSLVDNISNDLNISMFPQEYDGLDDDSSFLQTSEQQQNQYMNVNNSFFWNERLDRTANILSIREPILSLRRILYSLKNLQQEEAYCWLQLAKEARSHKQLSHANTALVYASKIGENLVVPYIKWQAFLEKIKLTYNQGEIHKSLMKTQKILIDHQHIHQHVHRKKNKNKKKDNANNKQEIPSQILSEMNVLIAGWMNETNSYESSVIINKYKAAITQQPQCEEPYFKFATYLDELYAVNVRSAKQHSVALKSPRRERTVYAIDSLLIEGQIPLSIAIKYKIPNLLSEMLEKYCLSLTYGHKHVFRSLPRLIELWCRNGRILHKITMLKNGNGNKNGSQSLNRHEQRLINSVDISPSIGGDWLSYFNEWSSDLPEYQFMCILPIITSRILADASHVQQFIETVLIRCLKKYPSQLLWHIALLINYKHLEKRTSPKRVKAAKKIILYLRKQHSSNNTKLFEEMTCVLSSLIQFTPLINHSKHKKHTAIKCPSYLLNGNGFDIVVPTQMNLEPSLSNTIGTECYSSSPVRIHRFCEQFVTMSSQAQPKKISLIGTDGLQYSFLIKREQRGDMRKDSRLMEVCGVINRLFNNNIESRNRNLNLHNYSVICITEQIGMIEWVENVSTLRNLLNETYTFDKLLNSVSVGEMLSLRDMTEALRKALSKLQERFTTHKTLTSLALSELFEKQILAHSPVIFHTFFIRNWINCNEWYNARLLYTRSCASWSIVGFMVALGDRHLENILINIKTGECIHVDFDCLFDRAKTFKVPEQVAFRLTNNIIDGFGIIGVEGVFRKSAECVLNVLKNNKETLLQSLRSFIHDPLISDLTQNSSDDKSMRNQLQNIRNRLMGYVPSMNFNQNDPKSYPKMTTNNILSTNGQVQQLIQQCSNKQLLAKMFVGWMPFI